MRRAANSVGAGDINQVEGRRRRVTPSLAATATATQMNILQARLDAGPLTREVVKREQRRAVGARSLRIVGNLDRQAQHA